ncbi:sigma factor-like helix-turn-helix DNA-binding protein [Clostridium beijerinckii]|uniref:RNA polymerase sigma factor 70 region 4 type 2 domain-containing protein n=1 Tax=Clostridium beijerinckii TaxID=1520 RepID=A0AAE5H302_CLOBE|nr:sigma factor-like helix-turn-helix DNA-binding protein [Clostridium beijerinckii]ALB44603.1 sigma-70 family RNA polymerase sigma factor [Clostridium beijerinckii NRRL B-598]NSB13042.1 hypothetical protein [Clostridium beijerinckii]OOM22144.1 sigma-70, region 4 [Clostridium beijerinckii]
MKKEKLINKTKILLKNVQALRESTNITEQQKAKVNTIIKALNSLSAQEQNLIAYKYFENKKQIEIAELMKVDVRTVQRKVNKIALDIGRIVYGFEDEFINILDEAWNALNDVEETEEQLIDRAMEFVINKMKEYKVIS